MDYEGKHFPEEEKKIQKEQSSKLGWTIRQIFKYTFWGICALVWGIILFRIFTSTDSKLINKMYFSDDAVIIAQKLGDDFTVYSIQTASTMNEDGTIQIRNNLYAEDAKEFEIGLRYRMKKYTGEKDTSLPFTVKLTDKNGKEYQVCNIEFTTKNYYGFARISFANVVIDKTANQFYFDDGDFSHDEPDINADNGQVLNTSTALYLTVYYEDEEVAYLQVYHDFAILDEIKYKQGR